MSKAVNPNWAVYDLGRLAKNHSELRRRVGPDKKIFAAIKGNAYGHGALPVARVLEREGVAGFMTGSFREACHLRANGVGAPVVMFAGALPDGIAELVDAGLIPTIVDIAGAKAAAAAGTQDKPTLAYVKLDMGLGRLGVPADEAAGFLSALSKMPGLTIAGLYTHLPFAERAGYEWAKGKFEVFDDLLAELERNDQLPPISQAGASSSIAAGITDKANSVCVGHLLFGLSPFSDQPVGDISAFKPVLREIGSRLVQVTDHHQGQDIAIAGVFGSRAGMRIGVAPIGAAQGLQRPAPGSKPTVLVRGRRVPIVSVSLEHLTLDLDDIDDAEVGDSVLLLGRDGDQQIEHAELAGWFGQSCLDSVLALSERLPAHYRGGP